MGRGWLPCSGWEWWVVGGGWWLGGGCGGRRQAGPLISNRHLDPTSRISGSFTNQDDGGREQREVADGGRRRRAEMTAL